MVAVRVASTRTRHAYARVASMVNAVARRTSIRSCRHSQARIWASRVIIASNGARPTQVRAVKVRSPVRGGVKGRVRTSQGSGLVRDTAPTTVDS